jgi:DNA-binding response OmpR family regulator
MRVLVVEDEPSVAESLQYLLAAAGHTVAVAGDGITALARCEAFSPDVVLLDLMLPRMNGLEVARRLRGQSEVAIIIISARSTDAEKVVGLEAGADDYMTKPFSSAELLARITAVTRGRVPATTGRVQAGRHVAGRQGPRWGQAGAPGRVSAPGRAS